MEILDPPGSAPLSVREVLQLARDLLRRDPQTSNIRVRGELSNVSISASGHSYFTLKEEGALLSCVLFSSGRGRLGYVPKEGDQVVVRGRLDFYDPQGKFQLVVFEMFPLGEGEIARRLAELEKKLEREGLFDPRRKRKLPPFPRRVGVVTSREGAVWKDIQNVSRGRFPGIHLLLYPVPVQGEKAAEKIARAIQALGSRKDVDVLIVGRGGGSREDLWAFNEEVVVRAVATCPVPVVSAVGHETDSTLTDRAADVRASTPSHAAEIVVPSAQELLKRIDLLGVRMRSGLRRRGEEAKQTLDVAQERLRRSLESFLERMNGLVREQSARLEALSPLKVLSRGYCVAEDERGRVLRSAYETTVGSLLRLRLHEGSLGVKVEEVHR